jgi:hypothetical protein
VERAIGTAKGTINAGVCGFVTDVTATSEDEQHVAFSVSSTCEHIRRLAEGLPVLDAYAELGAGFDGALHTLVRRSLRGCCSGCAVPSGLFKAMQIAAGVALPQAVSMEFEKL